MAEIEIDVSDLKPFELTSLLFKRTVELSKGAEPFVEYGDINDPYIIALMELENGIVLYNIVREHPDGSKVIVKVVKNKK
jgi:DNA-directed RNA polymerase subunit K/omega